MPEEQDVHADHDGYQREHVKHDGCLSSHRSFLLCATEWSKGGASRDFIDEFTGLDPETGEAALRAQTRLVHEWRRFPFLDPRLPVQLLPENWSGAKAADLFHARHADWHPAAQRQWERLTGDARAD